MINVSHETHMFEKTNVIHTGNCTDILSQYPDDFFDLTIFSPPYDDIRNYHGYTLDMNSLGNELFRTTKEGGIVIMITQDQTKNFKKSLTSFRTIIDWCDNIGWKLFECVIYKKDGRPGVFWEKRFRVDHEYIPIFFKGDKPKYFNKDSVKVPCKYKGRILNSFLERVGDKSVRSKKQMIVPDTKCRGTIWFFNRDLNLNLKRKHPAVFPDQLPYDFIQVFTEKGDIVLDPMIGSGTTAVMAKLLERNYVGIDISKEYCDIAKERVKTLETNVVNDFDKLLVDNKKLKL